MIFDTDILVWVARRNQQAANFVKSAEQRFVSVVSYMELLRGARDRRELANTRSFLSSFGLEVLPLTENIGNRAAIYLETYSLIVAIGVSDALIAATAAENNRTLATGNVRHFSIIEGIQLHPFTL